MTLLCSPRANSGRANQVTHIFNKEQVNFPQGKIVECLPRHISIQVTGTGGVYLNTGTAKQTYLIGIYGEAISPSTTAIPCLSFKPNDGLQNQTGFSAPGEDITFYHQNAVQICQTPIFFWLSLR